MKMSLCIIFNFGLPFTKYNETYISKISFFLVLNLNLRKLYNLSSKSNYFHFTTKLLHTYSTLLSYTYYSRFLIVKLKLLLWMLYNAHLNTHDQNKYHSKYLHGRKSNPGPSAQKASALKTKPDCLRRGPHCFFSIYYLRFKYYLFLFRSRGR